MRLRSLAIVVFSGMSWCVPATAQQVLRVGPLESLKSISVAAAKAVDGDVIEVAAGDYLADVAVWTKDRITVRGVGGNARLIASGASAERKAIWVVRGGTMVVENIEFIGARVPDRNGAGIRLEKGRLTVRNCIFADNENGILTGSDKTSELVIEGSEFGNNGAGDGQSHNLYVGSIARLKVSGSYFHHARVGHLLKSRAAENHILYNRLTDETGGRASYELEFPNGGLAYVIGNILQQGSQTENPHIVSFGAEAYKWPRNELYLINNTLVDDRPHGGVFLRVKPGADRVRAVNNLLVGKGKLDAVAGVEAAANFNVDYGIFALAVRQDYRIRKDAGLTDTTVDAGEANGIRLSPTHEYFHPRQTRPIPAGISQPGALQSLAR